MDVLDAQIRQVVFFDTPDLDPDEDGVVVRARRSRAARRFAWSSSARSIPSEVPAEGSQVSGVRHRGRRDARWFRLLGLDEGEVDDGPGQGDLCRYAAAEKLLTNEQRDFFADHAPTGLALDDLSCSGRSTSSSSNSHPASFGRRLVAELWLYPDGYALLELSTKCAPAEGFEVAAETKAFLSVAGIDLSGEQQTRPAALDFFAGQLSRCPLKPHADDARVGAC